MLVNSLPHGARTAPQPKLAKLSPETGPVDRLERSTEAPRLMVGVPTEWLSPQMPPPTNIAANVGVEIAPGLGISLDGRALLVGHQHSTETLQVLGGIQPQRDFKVSREGADSAVDGHFGWQDYKMHENGNDLEVTGETDRESFVARPTDKGFDVVSHFSGRSYSTAFEGNQAHVTCGYADGRSYTVTQEGNKTIVDGGAEEINFTVERKADGSIFVDGQLRPQDFNITSTPAGLDIKGFYEQQHYVVK